MIFIKRCFYFLAVWALFNVPLDCLSDDFLSDDELGFDLGLADEENSDASDSVAIENNEDLSVLNEEKELGNNEEGLSNSEEASGENANKELTEEPIKETPKVKQKVFPIVKTNDLFQKVKYGQIFGVNDVKRWLTTALDVNECLESGKTMLVEMVKKSSDLESISVLIDSGADMVTRCNPKYNVLFEATEHNPSSDVIDLLINKGGDILDKDYEQNNVVNIAGLNPKARVMQTLLEYGVDINNKNVYGYTPLMLASYSGNIKVVDVLLKNGAKIDEVDNKGRTALMAAALSGNNEVMDFLIKNGAKVKMLDSNNMSVLDFYNKKVYLNDMEYKKNWYNKYASVSENLGNKYDYVAKQHKFYNDMLHMGVLDKTDKGYDVAKEALDRFADIDFIYENKNTPLCEVGENGTFKVLKLLVDSGANVNAECNPVFSVTKGACINLDNIDEYIKKLDLLAKNSSDVNVLDENGDNALLFALKNGTNKEYIIKLIDLGGDVNILDKNKMTPLSVAFMKRDYPVEVYENIVKQGGDVNANSVEGEPLVWTEIKNDTNPKLLAILLKNNAKGEYNGDYPICYFLREKFGRYQDADKKMEVLDVLIKYEKNLNKSICGGYTPLTFAVRNSFPADAVRLFLEYGADPEVKDDDGISMVDYLSSREHYDDTIVIKTRENVLDGW